MRELLIASVLFSVFTICPTVSAAEGDTLGFVDQHYPDFGFYPPPKKYKGRVFVLSQKYPKTEPRANKLPEFLKLDFKEQWRDYLDEALKYCYRDNIYGGDVADDFDPAKQDNPAWFHMPWQHYGPKGREAIHGLTKEAGVKPHQLAVGQKYEAGQMYAVGLYNEFGGYTIGKVWGDSEHPERKHAKFPVGTVVFKLLFTDVPTEQVPWLSNPLLWEAYVLDEHKGTKRCIKKMALVQIDIMVRDSRAPYKWVFGTYQYNGNLNRDNKWLNMVPVGIQWGNDPDVGDAVGSEGEFTNQFPKVTLINPRLQETRINKNTDELPPTHLGWNGRLNGPADNYLSSCMSCHMTAQAPEKSPSSPLFFDVEMRTEIGSEEWKRWFANLPPDQSFDEGAVAVDYSLQMAVSLQNFYTWRDAGSKQRADQYKAAQEGKDELSKEYTPER